MEESEIEPCCWAVYSRNTEHKQTLAELDENFAYATDAAWAEEHNCKKWQIDLWTFLEEPNSSRGAKVRENASDVLSSLPLFSRDMFMWLAIWELLIYEVDV